MKVFLIIIFCLLYLNACESKSDVNLKQKNQEKVEVPYQKMYSVKLIRKIPHDTKAFTQGLTYYNGYLYETTGQLGQSSIRKVNIENGEILKIHKIPSKYFGEGNTIINNKLYYFTWQDKIGWTFELKNLKQIDVFCYDSEGWGMTNNGKEIIISDGSNLLRYKDTTNFNTLAYKEIFYQGKPLNYLNELELVGDELYANIWGSDKIAVIDINSGNVITLIDLSFLRNEITNPNEAEVLNGIAYIPQSDTFIVTGKNWSHYFEIKIY